jgi:hypothetical protein
MLTSSNALIHSIEVLDPKDVHEGRSRRSGRGMNRAVAPSSTNTGTLQGSRWLGRQRW